MLVATMRCRDLINVGLPDELLLEIFRRLDSKSSRDACSLVCKRWLRLERLSRTTLRIGASGCPDLFVKLLARRFVNVKVVSIDERIPVTSPAPVAGRTRYSSGEKGISEEEECESECFTDAGLSALANGFSKLEKLSLVWCSTLSTVGFVSFAQKCTPLRSLDLQGCYVGDEGLSTVGKYCKQLADLNLRFCDGLTDAGLVDLAMGCGKSLKSLSVAACAKITDKSLDAVGSYCKSLETLSLDSEFIHNKGVLSVALGCPLLKDLKLLCINVTDEALVAVGTYCSWLELLALYSFQQFTDEGLFAVGKGCKKLKDLTLSDCCFITDQTLEAISAGCTGLTHLEINGCSSIGTNGLVSIGRSCPHLTELSLLYCKNIGDDGLIEVGKGCRYLKALHLAECSSIGDDGICSIARGCPNLKKLHIRRCCEVGSRGIIAVGEHCHYLTDLNLRFCEKIGDEALIAVAKGCPLTHLNVSGCNQIGDAGVAAIARGCPQLISLDVSVLQYLGDMALAEVGEGCPFLREIVLSHCRQISDVGVSHLVKGCRMLESCHMVYCRRITATGVATVVSSCTNLRKVLVEKWKVSPRTKRRASSILSYLCVDL